MDMDAPPLTMLSDEVLAARWQPLRTLMGRPSRFGMETGSLKFMEGVAFEADEENQEMIAGAKVLCVGAGGLGCELLKDLALTGFTDIHVIDLDTIDVTNLNRQFLFRRKDVGEPKATVAAAFVNGRVPGCTVTPHFGKLQDFDTEWYGQFDVVIAGLDNLQARRFLNETLCKLVQFDPDTGEPDMMTVKPLIDGGTEGFKGQARVILPMKTSCFECTARAFPPAQGKAVCTLESNPRQPEDCCIYVFMKIDEVKKAEDAKDEAEDDFFSTNEQVSVCLPEGGEAMGIVLANEGGGIVVGNALGEDGAPGEAGAAAMVDDGGGGSGGLYTVRVRLPGPGGGFEDVDGARSEVRRAVPASSLARIRQQWVADFGAAAKVDKDSRVHMSWIHARAAVRAALFGISGLTYDKTLGAVKNIIPAVASTNAIVAAACVHEAVKCLTFAGQLCNTYMLYNGQSFAGVSVETQFFERDPECEHCQDSKPKVVTVPRGTTVEAFVGRWVLAPGALNLSTVVPGQSLAPPQAPQITDSEGEIFFKPAVPGADATPMTRVWAANLSRPLEEFVDQGEAVTVAEPALWGKTVKRTLIVKHA